jgi:pimeloyl-ACP methyl ester carboxylesterase
MKKKFVMTVMLTAMLAAIVAGCGGGNSTSTSAKDGALKTSLDLKACRVKGVDSEVKCATLDVFENRETKAGRKIALNIVVLPASARIKASDPIFLFAGGPGQAATDLAQQALQMLGALNDKRDIVLIDQRGTGKSNLLNCKVPEDDTPGMSDPVTRDAIIKKFTIECRDELLKKADLTQYTTTIAMADYDDVRVALGADKINMFGVSYGTRSSMEYLRRYPAHVRSAVLDAVAPPSMALAMDFARDAGAAYEKMLSDCAGDAGCKKSFPDLRADVDALLQKLTKSPVKAPVTDGVTGLSKEIEIGRDTVLGAIFTSLYLPELAAVLPHTLVKAKQGDYTPLLAQTALFSDGMEDKIAYGMRLSVACAEDVPRYTKADLDLQTTRAPFGRLFVDQMALSCTVWPKGKMAADFTEPVKSDAPILILSGGLDPVTPSVHGEEVKKTLANALHLIAPGAGHGVANRGCALKLVKKFVETANIAGIDGECLKKSPRPLFYEPLREKTDAEKAAQKLLKNNEGAK